jgi:hypothetical protein
LSQWIGALGIIRSVSPSEGNDRKKQSWKSIRKRKRKKSSIYATGKRVSKHGGPNVCTMKSQMERPTSQPAMLPLPKQISTHKAMPSDGNVLQLLIDGMDISVQIRSRSSYVSRSKQSWA